MVKDTKQLRIGGSACTMAVAQAVYVITITIDSLRILCSISAYLWTVHNQCFNTMKYKIKNLLLFSLLLYSSFNNKLL